MYIGKFGLFLGKSSNQLGHLSTIAIFLFYLGECSVTGVTVTAGVFTASKASFGAPLSACWTVPRRRSSCACARDVRIDPGCACRAQDDKRHDWIGYVCIPVSNRLTFHRYIKYNISEPTCCIMLYFIVYKPSPSAQDSNADSAFLLSAPFKWSSEEDWQVGYGERCQQRWFESFDWDKSGFKLPKQDKQMDLTGTNYGVQQQTWGNLTKKYLTPRF